MSASSSSLEEGEIPDEEGEIVGEERAAPTYKSREQWVEPPRRDFPPGPPPFAGGRHLHDARPFRRGPPPGRPYPPGRESYPPQGTRPFGGPPYERGRGPLPYHERRRLSPQRRRPSPSPPHDRLPARSPGRGRRLPSPPPLRGRRVSPPPSRLRERSRGSTPPRSHSPRPPSSQRSIERPAARVAGPSSQQKEALAASIREACSAVGLQDVIKELERVCRGLLDSLRKAMAYFELLQQEDAGITGADDSRELAGLTACIFSGLRSLHVLSQTGRGKDMAAAREAVQAAFSHQALLFTEAQRSQLEAFRASSKHFAALLDESSAAQQEVRTSYVPPAYEKPVPKQRSRPASAEPGKQGKKGGKGAAAAAGAAAAKDKGKDDARAKVEAALAAAYLPMDEPIRKREAPQAVAEPLVIPRFTAAATVPKSAVVQQQQQQPVDLHDSKRPRIQIRLGLGAASSSQPSLQGPAMPQHQHQQPSLGESEQVLRAISPMSAPPSPAAAGAPLAAQSNGQPAAQNGDDAAQGLLRQGKLCLVLDLDHTLLNSATFGEVGPELAQRLAQQCAAEASTRQPDQRLLFPMDDIKMWTKLRPGVREFLAQASQYFELWIHTNGNRAYAASVTRLLDPAGSFFGERIIAQGADRVELMQADQAKRLMQGLEGREAVTVIVDDSHSVWSEHRPNLVAVERYVYFPSSRTSLGMKGPSLLEANRDECPDQGMLMVALKVLMRVHRTIFSALAAHQPVDVRQALTNERQRVLAGVRIVFSRVIPLEMPPESHPLWQLAVTHGATCSSQLDTHVTHVVATTGGTEKVLQARQLGIPVVQPAWLECSCILWKRAHEERFLVPP